jgi:hypothetical protein
MTKRKAGERANILFDDIDFQILNLLSDPRSREGLQVLELANSLRIKHNSLKPHIDKLMFLKLINLVEVVYPTKEGNKKKRLLTMTCSTGLDSWLSNPAFYKEDKKQVKEEMKREKIILDVLSNANSYLSMKENEKLIGSDLRKTKSLGTIRSYVQKSKDKK